MAASDHRRKGPGLGEVGGEPVPGRAAHRLVPGPRAKPEFVPVLRELAAGLREGDGGCHLITFKPDPSPYSSSFLHEEPWLDFNSIQTWKRRRADLPHGRRQDYNLSP